MGQADTMLMDVKMGWLDQNTRGLGFLKPSPFDTASKGNRG